MADCEHKECYEKVYGTQNVAVTSIGGVAAAGFAPAVRNRAEAAITAKAGATKVVGCGDATCQCVRNAKADTQWGEWKVRQVKTTINVGGKAQEVLGTIERHFKKTKQGDCDDPGELLVYGPDDWDIELVAVRPVKPAKKRKG